MNFQEMDKALQACEDADARLRFVFEQLGHAYTNWFVEGLRARFAPLRRVIGGKDWAYWLGHLITFVSLLVLGFPVVLLYVYLKR